MRNCRFLSNFMSSFSKKIVYGGKDTPLMASQWDDVTPAPAQGVTESDSDYDAILMKQIDEKMLRRIFRGLCGEE